MSSPGARLLASLALLSAALGGAATPLVARAASTLDTPRERIRLDAGWRFHRGDAPDAGGRLDYDVRPVVDASADGKEADTRPDAAVRVVADRPVLKPWILPTANPLLRDRPPHARPAGPAPGGDVSFLQPGFDDSGWQPVTLPHDWAIAGPFLAQGPYGGMGRLPSWGIGWYRRTLDIPADAAGRSVFLDFDGAMSYATVWLDGQLVGGWPYGYSSWRVDLTPHVRPGRPNSLVVRLDNPPESARWYPGGGLYRDVWLTFADRVHVAQWGTTVTTSEVSAESAVVNLRVRVDNDSGHRADLRVDTEIFAVDADGRIEGPAVARIAPARLLVDAGRQGAAVDTATRIGQPRLWGPPPAQQPHRYVAVTTVLRDGDVIDRVRTPFGIRRIDWDPARGVVVNGEHVPLRGVNQHHDLGALGAAFNVRAAQRQLEILQGMGVNAIRMAHNPPDPQLLELTDRMGLLVIDEVFDSWEKKKTPLDFHLVFPDWHEADLRAMVRRDRNHPSVIAWSVGNEVGEQYDGDAGAAIGRRLSAIAHEEDPTRPTAASMNWAKPDMPFAASFDTISLNYQGEGIRQDPVFDGTDRIRTPPLYDAFRKAFPDKVIMGSETASAASSRGIYLFPVTSRASAPIRDGSGGDSRITQVSSYELHAVDFGASADAVFAAQDRHPFVAGEFVWNGFDYLGEPTPYYSARSSYTGIIDLAGFPKDRYWLYQSRWRPELPMAHLLPHWTWPGREGQVTPVHVFTSGDEAELFVNGVSQGRRKKGPYEYRLRWDEVVYQPGEIRVQAYRDGAPWASDTVHTAGAPARLELEVDRSRIAGDGRDLAFASVRVLDAAGRPVPTADTALRFQVEGAATLVATDNGDASDLTAFPSPVRKAFSGMALAIVRAQRGGDGRATLRVLAEGLPAAEATITVVGDAAAAPALPVSGAAP